MIEEILSLAKKLPSGLPDNKSLEKLEREKKELENALQKEDYLQIVLETVDCVYYAIKAEGSGLLDIVERNILIQKFAHEVNVPSRLLLECVKAKYELRAEPGNPKRPRAERNAVKKLLATRDPIHLPALVQKYFNEMELQEFCFFMDVDYEELLGQNISEKSLELVSYFKRRNNLKGLVEMLKKRHPYIQWD